jgi:hypothetical protein
MSAGIEFERRWSTDGKVLVAPDMMLFAGPMLERAQEQYGPVVWKDGWSLGGVVFYGENPSVRPIPGAKVVAIVLAATGVEDHDAALAFMAHEIVHCMHLDGEHTPPMIEEGAAVRFSLIEAAALTPGFAGILREHQTTAPGTEHYAEALVAVEQLLDLDPNAIRTLRTVSPDWDAITPERIRAVVPSASEELAALLCEVREMRPDHEHAAWLAEQETKT